MSCFGGLKCNFGDTVLCREVVLFSERTLWEVPPVPSRTWLLQAVIILALFVKVISSNQILTLILSMHGMNPTIAISLRILIYQAFLFLILGARREMPAGYSAPGSPLTAFNLFLS